MIVVVIVTVIVAVVADDVVVKFDESYNCILSYHNVGDNLLHCYQLMMMMNFEIDVFDKVE